MKALETEQLNLRGIGPNAVCYSSNRFEVDLMTVDGPLSLFVNTIPTAHFPQMIMVPVESTDAPELFTDPLEANQEFGAPDLIIGNACTNFLEIDRVRRLPSGFWLSSSKLGPIVDGGGTLANVAASITIHPALSATMVDESKDDTFYEKVDRFCRAEEYG
jgi:hypothetical protein